MTIELVSAKVKEDTDVSSYQELEEPFFLGHLQLSMIAPRDRHGRSGQRIHQEQTEEL